MPRRLRWTQRKGHRKRVSERTVDRRIVEDPYEQRETEGGESRDDEEEDGESNEEGTGRREEDGTS